jgi:hypothetical protein
MRNPLFYSSNTDKHFTPEEAGWYIQYHTESGDSGAIKVDRKPKDDIDALVMLEEINPDELWCVDYFAEVHFPNWEDFETEYNAFINSGGLNGETGEGIDHSKLIPWLKANYILKKK